MSNTPETPAQPTVITGKDAIFAKLKEEVAGQLKPQDGFDLEAAKTSINNLGGKQGSALFSNILHDSATEADIKKIAGEMASKMQASITDGKITDQGINEALAHSKKAFGAIYDAVEVSGADAVVAAFKSGLGNDGAAHFSEAHESELKGLVQKSGGKMTNGQIKALSGSYEAAFQDGGKAEEALKAMKGKYEELTKNATQAVEKAGFFASKFSKPSLGAIGENWKVSSTGIKVGRVAGTGLGVVLAGHGLSRTISKDEEGNSHPVSGLIETGVGAAAIAASLLAKGKGGAVHV